MPQLDQHPTVLHHRTRTVTPARPGRTIDASELRALCLELGADDVGFVEIGRPELADQRNAILAHFPPTRTLISLVCRMSRENIRTPSRSVANLEFHHTNDHCNEVGLRIIAALERRGVRAALGGGVGFPMEADRWPAPMWVVSHKPVAVAAGLGRMGIHRNVIHPRFGNFILLGTVLTELDLTEYSSPIDYNPCLECKLCVAACPTGAISPEGEFNGAVCYTHNYREFMGGFSDWVESVVQSRSPADYRARVNDAETVSMWQSLGYGPNYKAAYCMAVCPAGEDVIGPFLENRAEFVRQVVRPLQEKVEPVYVVKGSDAEEHVARRFPHKRLRRVGNGIRPNSIASFVRGARITFQPGQSTGLDAVYHFTFTGEQPAKVTFTIRDRRLEISDGHVGAPDFSLRADSRTWLRFLARETGLVSALLRRRIRFRGSPRLLLAFARCFPS